MAKNEELAVKMIFSAEQPLTGMNEGTWFPRRMCRRIDGFYFFSCMYICQLLNRFCQME